VMTFAQAMMILDAAMGDNWAEVEPTEEEILLAAETMSPHIGTLPGRYGRAVMSILSSANDDGA